jgi:hypothetical protein
MHGMILGLWIHGLRHTKTRLPTTRQLVAAADAFGHFRRFSDIWSVDQAGRGDIPRCALATYGPRTEQRDVYNNNALTNAMLSINLPRRIQLRSCDV